MHQSETDMIERIFTATNDLMATVGLPNLSIHKIAKEAKISPGTIYLYFKNKDELLEQFARYIFNSLEQDPTIVANMGQYEFLPGFYTICKEWETRGIWHRFCKKAVEAGEVCDLPPHLLFALSLQSALNIAFKCKHFAHKSSMAMLESVIDRTWRAIQK